MCACDYGRLKIDEACFRHNHCTCATEDAGDGYTWLDEGLMCLWCRVNRTPKAATFCPPAERLLTNGHGG